MLIQALVVMAAGALGAVSRFGIGRLCTRYLPADLPMGTLIVNLLGCLFFGFVVQATALFGDAVPRHLKLALTTGFLGAFTTFSTFGYETYDLISQGRFGWALANAGANLFVGLLAVWVGLVAAKAVFG